MRREPRKSKIEFDRGDEVNAKVLEKTSPLGYVGQKADLSAGSEDCDRMVLEGDDARHQPGSSRLLYQSAYEVPVSSMHPVEHAYGQGRVVCGREVGEVFF